MGNSSKFDFRKWRIRSDGEPYRRLFIYVTIVDGRLDSVDTYDVSEPISERASMADLSCFLDTYRDGTCAITMVRQSRDGAIDDLRKQFRSLTPTSPGSDIYTFTNRFDRGEFQLQCGR